MAITLLVVFYHALRKVDAYLNSIGVLLLENNQKKGSGFLMFLFLFILSSSMKRFGGRKCEEHWLERVSRLLLSLMFSISRSQVLRQTGKGEVWL